MAAKQSVKIKATNKNGAKYKKKVIVKQVARTSNGKQTTKYSYTKKIYKNGKYYYYYT